MDVDDHGQFFVILPFGEDNRGGSERQERKGKFDDNPDSCKQEEMQTKITFNGMTALKSRGVHCENRKCKMQVALLVAVQN